MKRTVTTGIGLLFLAVFAAASCGPSHRLGEFDFRGNVLVAVAELPASPDILTGPLFVGSVSNPLEAVLQAGSRAVREVSARSMRDNLARAVERVNVGAILEDEAERRAGRYLRAEPGRSASESDLLLEIYVHDFGIEASDWDATAYFFMEAEATLLDQHGGVEIWRTGVKARDPVGPEIYGAATARDIVTAAAILDLSDDDMDRALEGLSDFVAARITDRLRSDLRDTQRR